MTDTANLIARLLRYDKETGNLYWKEDRGKVKAGDLAGSINTIGYLQVEICGKKYPAHRIAWLLVFGVWPKCQIDHIDLCKSNNRISNLREATIGQNNCNTSIGITNTSGIKGVSFHKASNKWSAFINKDGRQIYLGIHETPQKAAEVVRAKREELHGDFANHG